MTYPPTAKSSRPAIKRALGASSILACVLALALVTTVANSAELAKEVRFALETHRGAPISRATFDGSYSLLYFGYTHCPDICPLGLATITAALQQLGSAADLISPYFVTVDPARDTPSRLAEYVTAFHPRLVGVTGNLSDIRSLANGLGVRFMVAALNDQVFVDHTSTSYLLGPDGAVVGDFDHTATSAQIANLLRNALPSKR